MNNLTITSKEVSSLKEMDKLFEDYCKKRDLVLDFSKDAMYNAYVDSRTGLAFEWFMHGVFRCIGDVYLKDLTITVGEYNERS